MSITYLELAASDPRDTELTHLRERIAELEKERDASQGTADDIYKKLMEAKSRLAELEEWTKDIQHSLNLAMQRSNAWRDRAEKAESRIATLEAAAAVDGDAQHNAAIEAAAQILDNHWDGERGDAIRSLKRG